MYHRAFLSLGLALAATAQAKAPAPAATPVILISIDGFRPDYLDRGVTPNLNALAASGVKAAGMRPSFPSITFPNHYTLVTGLRPDQHGIVGNTMEDPAIPGVRFAMSNHDAVIDRRWWDEAEPIWVTAEKHGVRSATMFWPGSEAAIHGVRPSEWKPFDSKVTPAERVDTVLGWLDLPKAQRPRFVTLYFDDVDHAGHHAGPDSREVTDAAATVDKAIGQLRAGLASRHIRADIIVVSDHGMAATSPDRVIRMDRIAPDGSYRWITGGSYAGVDPLPGQDKTLAAALLKPHDHMQCWRRQNIPVRFHYGHNPRVPAFICLADVGWVIDNAAPKGERTAGGTHGYDNRAPEMRATFLATGPDFRPGSRIGTFDNVDVYPLVMKLLHVPARHSDGTVAPFLPALRQAKTR